MSKVVGNQVMSADGRVLEIGSPEWRESILSPEARSRIEAAGMDPTEVEDALADAQREQIRLNEKLKPSQIVRDADARAEFEEKYGKLPSSNTAAEKIVAQKLYEASHPQGAETAAPSVEEGAAETVKRGGRSAEERAAAEKRARTNDRQYHESLDPDRRQYLDNKYRELKDTVDGLQVGDTIIDNDSGSVIGEVVTADEHRVIIRTMVDGEVTGASIVYKDSSEGNGFFTDSGEFLLDGVTSHIEKASTEQPAADYTDAQYQVIDILTNPNGYNYAEVNRILNNPTLTQAFQALFPNVDFNQKKADIKEAMLHANVNEMASAEQANPAVDALLGTESATQPVTKENAGNTNANPAADTSVDDTNSQSTDSNNPSQITEDMSEDERYERLKDSHIKIVPDAHASEHAEDISSLKLIARAKSKAEKIILPFAKKLGITSKWLTTPEVSVSFLFSQTRGLPESLNKQLRYGGDYVDFAKAIVNLEDILDNAILVEQHTEKFKGTTKEIPNLINWSVLLGAFSSEGHIIPVQFEIKNTSDAGGRLYLTVALTKIQADVLGSTSVVTQNDNSTRSLISAEYSLSDIVREINTKDKHFLKYIPDQMLSVDQIEAKKDALAEDQEKREELLKKAKSNKNNSDDDNNSSSGPSSPGGTPAVDGDTVETRERGESRNIRTDEARDQQLRDFKEKNPDIYEVVKNEKLLRKALDIFESQGVEGAAQTLEQALYDAQNGRKLPLEMVPLHKLVCDELSRQGQVERANRISSDIGAELTYFGQGSQANAILRNMSPTAKADAFAKFVNRIVAENNANVSQEAVDDLISRYRAAETNAERDAIIDDATTAIAQSSPTTLREAFTALRYLNMLGNFKTQGRNILGNTAMMIAAEAKDRVRAINQYAWNAVMRNHQVEQTSTLATSPKMFGEAWQMFNEDKDAAFGEGKYSDVAQGNKAVRDKKTIFKWNWKGEAETRGEQIGRAVFDAPMKVLEAYRKATSWAMNEGDVIFQKITYSRALADYAKAQGYDSLADVPTDKLQIMREYAIKQAQEATFHDDNAVSNWFTNFDKGFGKGKALTQGVAPFRKTPANVGVRMEEYSPIGLVNTAFEFYKAIHETGDFNAALNSAAKSLTGTGLAALGFMLTRIGKARGKEDDEKLAAYEKNVQGLGDYSLVLDDGTTISMDWLQPEAGAFFMGVEAAELCEDGWQADDFMALLGTTTDIALNMSFMSGVNDFIEEIANNKGNQKATPSLLLNAFLKYASQGVTNSLAGEAEQFSEQYRQTYYTDSDSQLPTVLQKQLAKLSGKTPGWDYQQADYIDAWGRKQDNGSVGMRAFESFLSPAYINEDRSTKVDDELKRLHEATSETVEGSVFPTVAPRSTEINGEKLTPEEYEIYQTKRGQTALKLVTDFINGDGYDELTDEQRAEIIKDLYKFANSTAKNSVLLSRDQEPEKNSEYNTARSVMQAGDLSWAEYYQIKDGRDIDGNGSVAQEETAQYLFENLPEDKAKKVFDAYYPDAKTPYEDYAQHSQEIKDAKFNSVADYNALADSVMAAKSEAKNEHDSTGNVEAAQIVKNADITDEQKDLLISSVSKEYKAAYDIVRKRGYGANDTIDLLLGIDATPTKNSKANNGSISQEELLAYAKEHPEDDPLIGAIWDSRNYSKGNWEKNRP